MRGLQGGAVPSCRPCCSMLHCPFVAVATMVSCSTPTSAIGISTGPLLRTVIMICPVICSSRFMYSCKRRIDPHVSDYFEE